MAFKPLRYSIVFAMFFTYTPDFLRHAAALGETGWNEEEHSHIRLIANAAVPYPKQNVVVAGLEIVLDRGWKTYWRTPGDGLAPVFDWNRSKGIAGVEVLWPAPTRLDMGGDTAAYGYKDRLVIPMIVQPATGTAPSVLRLDATYGVCEDVCIPVETSLELELPRAAQRDHFETLSAALRRVPKEQGRQTSCPHRFVKAALQGGKTPSLKVETASAQDATGLDLFVETPDGLGLPIASANSSSGEGHNLYLATFDSPGTLSSYKGEMLTLTMVADQGSCETRWPVQ